MLDKIIWTDLLPIGFILLAALPVYCLRRRLRRWQTLVGAFIGFLGVVGVLIVSNVYERSKRQSDEIAVKQSLREGLKTEVAVISDILKQPGTWTSSNGYDVAAVVVWGPLIQRISMVEQTFYYKNIDKIPKLKTGTVESVTKYYANLSAFNGTITALLNVANKVYDEPDIDCRDEAQKQRRKSAHDKQKSESEKIIDRQSNQFCNLGYRFQSDWRKLTGALQTSAVEALK
jgi:hypothetical protein